MNAAASIEQRNIAVVRRYFEGCQGGDLEVLLSTLDEQVVHYFLPARFAPIRGAQHLARHWCKFKRLLDPQWGIDRIIAQGDDVVSEWRCQWQPQGRTQRVMMRGSEWYTMRAGLILEIRAYFLHDEEADTQLTGYPYAPLNE